MITSNSLISIITPSFNRAWIIGQCIRSIQSQTHKNVEHIVADGASSDDTLALLQHEQREHSNYKLSWISERDHGVYDAINKGIRLAKGDIITYLNTDDFYFPYTLQTVVQAFERTNADIIYGDWMNYFAKTQFAELLPTAQADIYDLLSRYTLPQPAVFMRRHVFEKTGEFDLKYRLVADNEFFARALALGFKAIKIDEFLAAQTIHDTNLLAGNSAARAQSQAEQSDYIARILSSKTHSPVKLSLRHLRGKFRKLERRFALVQFALSFASSGKKWPHFVKYLREQNASFKTDVFIKYLVSPPKNRLSLVYLTLTV